MPSTSLIIGVTLAIIVCGAAAVAILLSFARMTGATLEKGGPLDTQIEGRELSAMPCVAFPHRMTTGGTMMKKVLLAGALTAFTATSAFAQATTASSEYYVVRDVTTKKCTIVDTKPTTTTTIVDNGIFRTRTEAETGMKTMKVCTEN